MRPVRKGAPGREAAAEYGPESGEGLRAAVEIVISVQLGRVVGAEGRDVHEGLTIEWNRCPRSRQTTARAGGDRSPPVPRRTGAHTPLPGHGP